MSFSNTFVVLCDFGVVFHMGLSIRSSCYGSMPRLLVVDFLYEGLRSFYFSTCSVQARFFREDEVSGLAG